MSYDVRFEIDTGGPEMATVCDGLNYTSNCSPMFREALGGRGLHELNGMIAGESIALLRRAVDDMRAPDREAVYVKMNPANGWGSFPTATNFMAEILERAEAHPKATIRVSY